MVECRKFRVEGKVQGVWFRESTRQQAARGGVTGYARNCADGSVEVLACGSPEALSALRDWLRHGPPLARVTRVEERTCDASPPEGFETG